MEKCLYQLKIKLYQKIELTSITINHMNYFFFYSAYIQRHFYFMFLKTMFGYITAFTYN